MLDRFQRTLVRSALQAKGHTLAVHALADDDLLVLFHNEFDHLPIQAIKEFRSVSGMGLKESKDEFDRVRPLAKKAKLRREAERTFLPNLREGALDDLDRIVTDLSNGQDDEWTQDAIARLRRFIENC